MELHIEDATRIARLRELLGAKDMTLAQLELMYACKYGAAPAVDLTCSFKEWIEKTSALRFDSGKVRMAGLDPAAEPFVPAMYEPPVQQTGPDIETFTVAMMGFLGEPVRCKDSPPAPVRLHDPAKEKPRGCPQVLTFQPWRNVTSPSAMARAMESCESPSEKKPGFKTPAPITTSPTGTFPGSATPTCTPSAPAPPTPVFDGPAAPVTKPPGLEAPMPKPSHAAKETRSPEYAGPKVLPGSFTFPSELSEPRSPASGLSAFPPPLSAPRAQVTPTRAAGPAEKFSPPGRSGADIAPLTPEKTWRPKGLPTTPEVSDAVSAPPGLHGPIPMTLPYLADEQKPRSQSSVTTSSDAATTAPSASEATTSAACSPTPSPSSAPRPSPDGRKAFQPAFAEKVEEETSGDYAAFPGSYS